MPRFLHTADWQLGMTRHFLAPEAQSRFTQDRIDAIRRLGELAREHGAQFVVVGGDVFETNQVERQTVARALDALRAVPVPVFLLPGNHDPLDAASVFRSATFAAGRPEHVVLLESSEPHAVPGVPGVEVVGAPWRTKRPLADLVAEAAAGLEPAPAGTLRVLVGHGAVDALSPDAENPALVRLAAAERALAEGRVHYVALGDRHSVTRVGGSGAIWYAGAPVATDFDEERPGRALLVELVPGAAPQVRELAVGGWRFVDQRFDLAGADDVEALARWLAEQPEKERSVVRLTLVGTLPLAAHARLEDLLDAQRELFASLALWERHTELAVQPEAPDAEALGLGGYARTVWDGLAERAGAGGEVGEAAADALALLYRLAGGARA